MDKLSKGISQLGDRLVRCKLNCAGINNNPYEGMVPRCFYFEHKGEQEDNGCIIVGINPEKSSDSEKQYYIENSLSYKTINDFWNNYGYKKDYYEYLREFVKCAGYSGPILWTVLVKCENDFNSNFPSLQTFRTCTNNFFTRELELVPNHWPIIAIGREAHKTLSYLYPTKSVLGIPHPESRGHARLFVNKPGKELKPCIHLKIEEFKQNPGITAWLAC